MPHIFRQKVLPKTKKKKKVSLFISVKFLHFSLKKLVNTKKKVLPSILSSIRSMIVYPSKWFIVRA